MSGLARSTLPVVIPAAGRGARFLPLSRVVAKELLPLGRLPLIHHALLEAERAGLGPVVVVTAPSKRAIREYFESDAQLERNLVAAGHRADLALVREPIQLVERLDVRFVEAEARGPGEAVLSACEATGMDTVAVLFPDDVIPGPTPWPHMYELFHATRAAVMSLRRVTPAESERFGVAECERRDGTLHVRRLVEKPARGTVDTPFRVFGRYIVTAPVLRSLARRRSASFGELQLTDGYADSLGHGGVLAYEFTGEAFDCGTPEEYADSLQRFLASGARERSGVEQLVGG